MSQNVLHRAEESGQSRELTIREVGAYGVMSGLKGLILGLAGSTAFSVLRGLTGDLTLADVGLSLLGFGAMSTAWHLLADLDDLKDGLRSYRSIETYTPPAPEPQQVGAPSSPIVVKPYGGDPYVLNGEERLALPDGRQTGLGLNPPTLAAVLQEVIKQHDGQWSRSRLMKLRINGQRVTRSLYEQLTDALAKSGFLQAQANGGYALPPDVREFEDVRRYLPSLGGREGGREGGKGGPSGAIPPSRGVGTLAERRKQQWLECGCDVELYRGGEK